MVCHKLPYAAIVLLVMVSLFLTPPVLGADYYVDKILNTPDYTQTDSAYGGFYDDQGVNHGGVFCGPTSASNGLLWLADHGFPNLAPNTGDRKRDQHDVIDTIAGETYLDAYDNNGVGVNYLSNGLAYYINDCGYEFDRIEAQTWRYVSNHYTQIDTGVNRPNLDWARDGIESPYSVEFWNIGWYTYDPDTNVYYREGGHWVSMVGWGRNTSGYNPDYFIVHDPSPRCGSVFRNEYVLPTVITSGTMTGGTSGLPQDATGYHLLSGWPISSSGNCAILDAVVLIDITPVYHPGDANGDGSVDVIDLGILATYYGAGGGFGWFDADFTGDGAVNVSDLGLLATNYGFGTAAQVVPEPSMFAGLLVLCLSGLLAAAHRKR